MVLETALRNVLLIPHFIQMGNEEPRKVHWLGRKEPDQLNQDQDGKRQDDAKKRDKRGYRELSSITLGEVNDAYKYFSSLLLPSPFPAWIAANHFCLVDLVHKSGETPPAIFGRVKTCFPSDGYIQNIQEMELFFPQIAGAPDLILLHPEDILPPQNKPIQSFCVRVHFLVSPEDQADFDGCEPLFFGKGFIPEFNTGFIDLLDYNDPALAPRAGLYVIGSRWFASIPVSVQPEIRERLTSLIRSKTMVFNYHPYGLPIEIKSLNRELGYKAGFTKTFIIEPETPPQTALILESAFEEFFRNPMEG